MEVFSQVLRGPVWDGNLASKKQRDLLKEAGFIDTGYGFNFITVKGVEAAVALGMLVRGEEQRGFVVKDCSVTVDFEHMRADDGNPGSELDKFR